MLRKTVGFITNTIRKYRIRQQRITMRAVEFCLCRCYEKRLGINTLGFFESEEKQSFFKDELPYQAVRYVVIRKILHYFKPGRRDVIMDIGCGKGRIICFFAAERRMRRAIGIELDKDLYEAAVENINRLKVKKTQINIYHADAVNFTDINDVTIFIIFNPFGEKTLTKVIKNIENSLKVNPRAIHIAYFPTPNLARLFNDTPWLFFKKRLRVMAQSPIFIYGNQKD